MINVGINQTSAVLRAPYGVFQKSDDALALMEAAMMEVIMLAKAAGVKFSMGTNNVDNQLGTLDYAIEMIEECELKPDDFFKPVKK